MTIAGVRMKRFSLVNEALDECKKCIDAEDYDGGLHYSTQAINMAGQYGKQCSDLSNVIEGKGIAEAVERLREDAGLFFDLRDTGIEYYNRCLENAPVDLNDPRR